MFLALLLAVIELGSFGARWIRWQSLAAQTAVGSVPDGSLPPWWEDEALRAACDAPEAFLRPGDPLRVTLDCTYHGIAVNGLTWRVESEAVAADPSPSPSPEPTPDPSIIEASS